MADEGEGQDITAVDFWLTSQESPALALKPFSEFKGWLAARDELSDDFTRPKGGYPTDLCLPSRAEAW
jgi:hypothetical protein